MNYGFEKRMRRTLGALAVALRLAAGQAAQAAAADTLAKVKHAMQIDYFA